MPADPGARAGARILLLTDVFPPRSGGSGRWLWELYRRLRGVSVEVVAGATPAARTFDRTSTLPIVRVPLSFSSWGVWSVRGLAEYCRALFTLNRIVGRLEPDVVHCGKCLPEGLLASVIKRWRGIPFYCFVHGEELTLAGTSKELTRLTRRVLRESAGVIANSRHSKDLLMGHWGVPESHVLVMNPGVDTSQFRPAAADDAVRQRLGWSGRRVILTVGALQKRKGQDMMIRALPAIRARCPNVLYSIVGEGWERPYLDELIAQQGVADLVQFRSITGDAELIDCYQQCDLFALPNRQVGWDFEGFGIVLIEAQACGKPVIAGASGGTAETIEVSQSGCLVPCDTPEHLARIASDLLDDGARRARMGAHGRARAVGRFDWAVLVERAQLAFHDVPHSWRADANRESTL